MPLLLTPPKTLPSRGTAVLSSPQEPWVYLPWAARGEKLHEGESMTLTEWENKLNSTGLYHNEMVAALAEARKEIARLRGALQFIANHTAEPGTALDTVAKFAAATLDEVK